MRRSERQCANEGFHSAPQCTKYSGACFKSLYTNAHSMWNKQEELETLARSQTYDDIGLSETWWEESCGGWL